MQDQTEARRLGWETGEPRRQACHPDWPSQAYLREIGQQVALIMLFQPIELLCIHGKCN